MSVVDVADWDPLRRRRVIPTTHLGERLGVVELDRVDVSDDAPAIFLAHTTGSIKDLDGSNTTAEDFGLELNVRFFNKLTQGAVFN